MRPSRSAAELIVGAAAGGRPPSAGDSLLGPSGRSVSTGPKFRPDEYASMRLGRRAQTFKAASPMTKLEFRHTGGNHGLQWDGTVIIRVSDQAKEMGVQPGWKIHMIDNQPVHSSEDVWNRLQEAKWEWRSCYVSFVTDLKTVRSEQAMMRAAEMKAEAERLTRLPFAGAHDARHLSQVRDEFSFQGYTERVEDRGITFAQLQRVIRFAREHCHRWRDAASADVSETSGQKLHLDIMNMHHLQHWLVKPATREKDCSLMELLSSTKQPPQWFIISWWGHLLVDFVKCMEVHLSQRRLPHESTAFWLGAFACRPHSFADDICEDFRKTCYYKAMAAAKFQVLFMLDRKQQGWSTAGTVFNRLWCLYEVTMCFEHGSPCFDIATCPGSSPGAKPCLLTVGLTEEEQEMETRVARSGYDAKVQRERTFSLDLIEAGLGLELPQAQCTEPGDRARLLNHFAGRPPDQAPLPSHENYAKMQKRIASTLALAFWRRGMVGAPSDSDCARIQNKLIEAVRNDSMRESLDLSMAFLREGDEKVKLLHRMLPANLKSLKLDLKSTDVTNETLVALVGSLPADLESLEMDLSSNDNIANQGIESMVEKLPGRLRTLRLCLASTKVDKELEEKSDTLERLRDHITTNAQKGTLYSTISLFPGANGSRRPQVEVSKGKL